MQAVVLLYGHCCSTPPGLYKLLSLRLMARVTELYARKRARLIENDAKFLRSPDNVQFFMFTSVARRQIA